MRSLFFCFLCLTSIAFQVQAQPGFGIGIQFSPKLCANNNTSIFAAGNSVLQNNESDGHAAFGRAFDFQIYASRRIGTHDFLLLGAGTFELVQKFSPSVTLFGSGYRSEYRAYRFAHVPLEYYRHLGSCRKMRFYGSVGLDFVSDIFQNRVTHLSPMFKTGGEAVANGRVEYVINHLNMETFNVLASCAVRAGYAVSKRFDVSAALQLKQGFRPLITAAAYFVVEDQFCPQPYSLTSHETSINNGQGILLNIGMEYRL